MPNKFRKDHRSPGYWGTPWRTVEAYGIPDQIRVLLQDKMVMRGRWVQLYLPVSSSTPGVVSCTCVKDTTDSSDRQCLTCFGAKLAPGFLKFLHLTQFWCSAEDSSFTLTNVVEKTTTKANRLVLADGQLTGTIVTQDKPYDNTPGENYELQFIAYRKATGSSFVLEFSIDTGTTWHGVSLTETPSPGFGFTASIASTLLSTTGNVRFRVTMSRLSIDDQTPAFEIIRLRRVKTEGDNLLTLQKRPDHIPGSILILRPWTQEDPLLEAGRGRLFEHMNDQTWALPLDFYDVTIPHDTPACRVADFFGPHAFYSYVSGVQTGTRYAITKVNISEQLGTSLMTHQYLPDRRVQDGESINLCW